MNLDQVPNKIWSGNGDVWCNVCCFCIFKFFKSGQYSTENCIHKLDFFNVAYENKLYHTIDINIDVKIIISKYQSAKRFSELLK